MYYRWKDERIVVKIAVWGAEQGTASQFLHTLSDEVLERADAGEFPEPDPERAVGLRRNARPRDVDEEDRTFSVYVLHPPGESGEFEGTPVDFKFVAPVAPVEGNRAFTTAVSSATAAVFLADGGPDAASVNRPALRALVDRVAEAHGVAADGETPLVETLFGPDGPLDLRLLAAPTSSHRPDPDALRASLALPDDVDIRPTRPWNGPEALEEAMALAEDLMGRVRQARKDGVLPGNGS